MTIINNIDSQRFSFNGVEYYKNFTPVVIGNKIRILNTYDSSIELTSFPTLFSDFEVDSVTYGNVADLQSALLTVLYTRDSLGGSGLSTFTIDLMDLKVANFYAPNPLRINSISNVKNAPTTTIKVNDLAYTLGKLIAKGDKITVEVNIFSVVNLNANYE